MTEPRKMGLGSRLKLDLCIFIFSIALFSSPVFSDLIISKFDRRIDLTSHIVKVTSNIKVENDGNEPISDFVVAFPDHQAKHLASLSAFHIEGKGKTKSCGASLPLKPVQSEGIPQSLTSYSVSLPKKLVKGESLSLEVFAVFAHILKPFPEKVSQGDFQLVVFQDSAYYLSPYAVKAQTLSVKLPDARIESYTKLENSKAQGSEIKYGPYENQSPFSYSPVVVHFEYNKPYAVAQKLVREIEISHWGNVQITEHYNLVHGGAILKGEFSRLDHQMSSYAKGASSFSRLVAKLPPRAHSVYYRDEIGNISTSNLQSNSKKTELEIEPRYPLFGGWKTFFTFGYGLPLKDYLFEAEGTRFVNISFGSPIDELVVDELIVKVVLPEGSSDLSVSIPFPVEQWQETKVSHLDISGRPVMVLRKVNAVPEHNQHFQVYYKFNCLSLLREPLMLISGFFFLFVAGIAYSHADFSISKSSASYLARVQREEVQTIIQQLENIISRCLAIRDKLEVSLRELSRTGNVQACKNARTQTQIKTLVIPPLMASDSHDSHRKHSRSPSDDDSPEKSKRHKHRHHRHHRRHRHHYRHSSSKHGDAKKDEIEVVNREEVVEEVTKPAPLVDYDDMEEGEIVDDEGVLAAEVDSFDKKVGSDVESGEFKAGDDSYMIVGTDLENPESNHNVTRNDKSGKSKKYLKSPRSDRSGSESKEDGSHSHHDEFPLSDRVANGDLTRRSRKGESRSHTGHESPLQERSKEKDRIRTKSKHAFELMEVDEDDLRSRRDSFSHKVRDDRHEARYLSPSHGRYHLETSDRSWSKSPDWKKERERSQSIAHERYSKTRHRSERDEKLYDNGKVGYEVDDEKDSRGGKDYRSNGGEKVKDKGGERSSSYHRSSLHEGKHEDGDSKHNETEEKMYRDKKRMEQELIKERSERERDRIRSRDHEREKDFVRDRGIHREVKSDIDWNRDRGGSRDRDHERDRERERRREQDRGRSRDRDLGRERRRDDSTSMYKDRDAERERDKVRDRSQKSEMDRGRDRYSGSDRHRDKARDNKDDRSSRYHKYDDRDDVYSNRDRRSDYDEAEYFKDRKTKHDPYKDKATKDDSLMENEDALNGDDDDKDMLELKPAEPEEDDIDRIKEESRRRREAILQKYKAKQFQQQQAVPEVSKVSDEELTKQPSLKLSSASAVQKENNGAKGDANKDSVGDTSLNLRKSAPGNDLTAAERNTVMLGEGSPKSERSNDMFCDDIFGDSPAGVRKMGKGDGLPLERSGLHDNWDDPEGYYSFRFGEILDGRYEITAAHGKGVFSTVVRAKDLKAGSGDPEEVAIKIIRNNETMLKAGTEELVILKKLVGSDPDDRRHCVRYLSNFKYRNHLCIVFESLHMNLREVLKKFGRNIGLKLTAVRTYAKQLFIALKHLRNCGVLHCDIKPDNMLVNESKNVLKLCDFGNAMFAGKNEITPYLVSRFYRAPEIILGLPYDHPMDIWSVGCCLYELYTGKVLFPGPSNNDMLRLHMELKGPFPKKMLRKGAFIEQHFDQDLNFLALDEDPVTKKTLRKLIVNIKPKDVGNIIRGSSGEDPKMLANFKDLLEKIFVLDPDKRLTVSQALNHPFITGK